MPIPSLTPLPKNGKPAEDADRLHCHALIEQLARRGVAETLERLREPAVPDAGAS